MRRPSRSVRPSLDSSLVHPSYELFPWEDHQTTIRLVQILIDKTATTQMKSQPTIPLHISGEDNCVYGLNREGKRLAMGQGNSGYLDMSLPGEWARKPEQGFLCLYSSYHRDCGWLPIIRLIWLNLITNHQITYTEAKDTARQVNFCLANLANRYTDDSTAE